MYHLSADGFRDGASGVARKTIEAKRIEAPEEKAMQDASLNEYSETHMEEHYSPSIQYIMEAFQRFIGYHLFRNPAQPATTPFLLDIGCGISPHVPPYVRVLAAEKKIVYVGLDPFDINPDRDYFFIHGVFEGLREYLDQKFDYVIFSTSLDHLRDLDAVQAELRAILKKDGIAFFCVGVHDPRVIFKHILCEKIRHFDICSWFHVVQYAFLFPLLFVRLHFAMKKRSQMLSKELPLDSLHFHYFTMAGIDEYMHRIGNVIEQQEIDNTNVIFYAVRMA